MTIDDDRTLQRSALRLTVQFIAVIFVVLLIVAGVVFAIVSNDVRESNQRSLAVASQLDNVQETPSGTFITVLEHGRQQSSQGIPDGLIDTGALGAEAASGDGGSPSGGAGAQGQRTVDGQTYLVSTSRHGDRVVQVAVNLSEGSEELRRLAEALAAASLIALAAAAVASYIMARRAIRPLSEALTRQRQFVADASHELRTPLTILSTRAQILQRRVPKDVSEDVSAAVHDMVDDAKTLTAILDDLLAAADTRSATVLVPIDVEAVAAVAITAFRDTAARRNITLLLTGQAEVKILGSESALLRLFRALIANALDHAEKEVRVHIATNKRDAVIKVTDDGPGFDPAIVDRAFDRFASTRSGLPSDGDSHYGLGLALVAEITRRHHGTATIESPAPSGATVVVRLPSSR